MRWLGIAGSAAGLIVLGGCQQSSIPLDPFLGPQRIAPPATGSAVPLGTAPYNAPTTVPAYPSTTPAYPSTTPAYPSTPPAYPSTPPAYPSTPPAYPSTTPAYPSTTLPPAGSPAPGSPYAPPGGFTYPQSSTTTATSNAQQVSWVEPRSLKERTVAGGAGSPSSTTSSRAAANQDEAADSTRDAAETGGVRKASSEAPVRIVEPAAGGATAGSRRNVSARPAGIKASPPRSSTSVDITELPDAK